MSSHGNNDRPKLKTLPDHLIHDQILTRLPVKSLLRFKVVCKRWLHVVCCSKFVKSHLKFCNALKHENYVMLSRKEKASRKYGEVTTESETENQCMVLLYDVCSKNNGEDWTALLYNKICRSNVISSFKLELNSESTINAVCSCNGLVCFFSTQCVPDVLCIWNPATRQCRQIRICPDKHLGRAYGFGYASSVDDYIIAEFLVGEEMVAANIRFRIFSLKKSNWKNIPCCLTKFGYQPLKLWRPELVENTLYWLLEVGGKWYILHFDLDTQQFVENPWPITNFNLQPVSIKPWLVKRENKLSFIDEEDQDAGVWTMTKNGDMNSWQKVDLLEDGSCCCTPKTEIYESMQCFVHHLNMTSNHFELRQVCCLGKGDYVYTLISPFGDS